MHSDLFGIYLHWPYCRKICPYCDFNVYAAKARDPEPLINAMQADLEAQARQTEDKKVTSVYFGGGSPSLLSPNAISGLRERIETLWATDSAAEITLEVNPEDVDPDALMAWQDAGVTRISLGVQALDDEALQFLGRAHTSKDAVIAIKQALGVFDNVSVDMIYARPGQSIEDWLDELSAALSLGAPHLSLYELTIKEKTAFQKQVERAQFTPLDEDAQADLYLETLRLTSEHGLPAYEVSNHAKDKTYWSRHNLTYWLGGDWLGVGPGAEGRFSTPEGRHATRGEDRPADYIRNLSEKGSALSSDTILTS
jgi:putative oxygen-independent coproporphyrinogen III oxidase